MVPLLLFAPVAVSRSSSTRATSSITPEKDRSAGSPGSATSAGQAAIQALIKIEDELHAVMMSGRGALVPRGNP